MLGIFVQKYEKIFFDFYGGEIFFDKAWRREDVKTLASLVREGVETNFV